MTSSKNTLWIAGTGVLAVLILVASYFLLLAPKRVQASDTVAQAVGVEQSNQTLAAETERLKAQFATIDEQRAKLVQIRSELPAESEVPDLIRQFSSYATGAGVTVTEIAPGTLTPYVAAVSTTDATTATGAAATDSGIQTLPVSVTIEGSFPATELFVKNLQADMNRYMLVQGVDVVRESATLSTTITGALFVLADTTSATTAGAATNTTATAASSVSTGASTSTGTVN